MKNKVGTGTAHGKVILIGEHAVVYGVPAIALPLTNLKVNVQITKVSEKDINEVHIFSNYYSGTLSQAPATLDNLKAVIQQFFKDYSLHPVGLRIQIDSDLPSERGMGSSAAVATALVKALFDYFEIELPDEVLDKYVNISETIAHGNPSGIDALIVKSMNPYEFKKNTYANKISLDLPGILVLADTGEEGQTKEAIQAVAKYKEQNPEKFEAQLNDFDSWIQQSLAAIKEKDLLLLGELMNRSQDTLSIWGVSNEKLDRLVQTARENGAIAAKITGGGRGGCMIALTDTLENAKQVASQLENAGAANTWVHNLQTEEVVHDL